LTGEVSSGSAVDVSEYLLHKHAPFQVASSAKTLPIDNVNKKDRKLDLSPLSLADKTTTFFGATTLSITTLSIITLSINETQHK
jgi:hypothetical protein